MPHSILQRLYELTPRDTQSGLWGPFNFSVTTQSAATTIIAGGESQIDIPQGYNAIFQGLSIQATPGAGQNVDQGAIGVQRGTGAVLLSTLFKSSSNALGADVVLDLDCNPDYVVPWDSGRHPMALCIFNAGVAANTVTLSAWGILIPKGNIVLF